jgi:uncharacterized protein (DUF342 family)
MAEASKEGSPPVEKSQPEGAQPEPASQVGTGADYLEIKTEPTRATLTIKGSIVLAGIVLTQDDIAKKLTSLGVIFGVDWATVDRMISGKQYDRAVIIASGSPPRPSKDAFIQEKLKIDADVKPILDKDDKADYKNVDNIHQVKKGDVLAVKTAATQGDGGSDIFGKSQPMPPGKDVAFKLGVNTEISPDGLTLVASTGGYVYHLAGAICVGVIYVHKGDVDFKSGNLHYQGDIQVLGDVTTGFTVEAQGHILVEGNVDAGEVVSHGGDVTIKAGVFGHNTGHIKAKGNINLMVAQDVRIECESGVLTVDKGLRNCSVLAKSVKADQAGCSVVGGDFKAFGDVQVAMLGGEGCHTEIFIVDKDADAAKAGLAKIEKTMEALHAKIAPIETRLKAMKTMAARFGGTMSERSKGDLKAVLEQYMAVKGEEKEILADKEKFEAVLKLAPKHVGTFTVTEKIIWGAKLHLYGHARELLPEDVRQEWVWVPDGLLGRTILSDVPVKKEEGASPTSNEPPVSAAPPS